MTHPNGTWERVVADVVIAGQPRVVLTLANHTLAMAEAIPEHADRLGTLVKDLCDRKDGWRGRAATEFQDLVGRIAHEIDALGDDLTVLAGQLNGAGASLSEAIAHIPVPLTKTTSWGWDVDHELPNHTPMDDSLHDPNTFQAALVADYTKDPSRYQDFLALVDDPVTGRTATANDADYRGVPPAQLPKNTPAYDLPSHQAAERANRLAHWYSHNASIALHWQSELANDYQDRRDEIHISPDSDLRGSDRGPNDEPLMTPPPGYAAAPGTADATTLGDSAASPGGVTHPAQYKASAPGSHPSLVLPNPQSRVNDTGLASVFPSSVNGSSNSQQHTVQPDSLPYGTVSPGSANSGPDLSPIPPLTSAHQAISPSEPGTSASRHATSPPMGFMPTGGNQAQKRDERRTWLTEDEDYWSTPLGPPSVIE